MKPVNLQGSEFMKPVDLQGSEFIKLVDLQGFEFIKPVNLVPLLLTVVKFNIFRVVSWLM